MDNNAYFDGGRSLPICGRASSKKLRSSSPMHLRSLSLWYVQSVITSLYDVQLTAIEHGNENAWVRYLDQSRSNIQHLLTFDHLQLV
jgi:hypothetical protein